MNSIVSALRFFLMHTLDRPDLFRRLHTVKHPRSLPTVLSPDEVARLLGATTSLKHQAALSVAYGAGLRVAAVAMLKVSDIDSERMLITEISFHNKAVLYDLLFRAASETTLTIAADPKHLGPASALPPYFIHGDRR